METPWLEVVRLDSWEQFKQTAAKIAKEGIGGKSRTEVVFRGQPLASYELVASLDRYNGTKDVRWLNRLQEKAVKHFRTRNPEFAEELTAEQILAVLQHHGCPTRLLDWTTSPYVAAFFALSATLEIESDEDYCAVWALWTLAAPFQASAGLQVLEVPQRSNPRSWAQRGLFTSNNSLSPTIGGFLDQWHRRTPIATPVLWKLQIPRAQASDARADLALMGIDDQGLFPDTVGAARAAYFSALEIMRMEA